MGFISLVDEIQFMLISSSHICIRSIFCYLEAVSWNYLCIPNIVCLLLLLLLLLLLFIRLLVFHFCTSLCWLVGWLVNIILPQVHHEAQH